MKKKILAFIFNGDNFLTLRNNSKDPKHGGDFWFTVTGSLDNDETDEQAVKREVKEETGLEVFDTLFLNCYSIYSWNGQDYQEKNFIAFVNSGPIRLNEEHIESKWLNIQNFINSINWKLDKNELKKVLINAINKKIFFEKLKIWDFRK